VTAGLQNGADIAIPDDKRAVVRRHLYALYEHARYSWLDRETFDRLQFSGKLGRGTAGSPGTKSLPALFLSEVRGRLKDAFIGREANRYD
jgi:hypothetical protein